MNIITVPNPILNEVSDFVTNFDDELKNLIVKMRTIVRRLNAFGIAAPQLGVLRRVLLCREKVYVNPVILSWSPDKIWGQEACLSVPNVVKSIRRSRVITGRAQTEKGNWFNFRLTGQDARIFQHELDHLNGILIINHAKSCE